MTNNIRRLTTRRVKNYYPEAGRIGESLILIDCPPHTTIDAPWRMECDIIALCTSGTGYYVVNDQRHDFQANEFLLISEGQVLTDFRTSDDFDGVAFVLSVELSEEIVKGVQNLSRLFMFFRSRSVFRVEGEERDTLVFYFNLIQQKVKCHDKVFREEIVTSLFKAALYELGSKIWKEEEMQPVKYRAERVFNAFIKLLEANFRQERRVSWYANQLCISPKYLCESVKQVSQHTPNDWIDHYVIVELKVQLKNTMKSVKEIARAINFPNQSFMGKYFKQHTGMSPLRYRKG